MRSLVKRGWFQIAVGGTALFFAARETFKFTSNFNLLPTYIMLGAFLVPVAFAAYFYRQEHILDREIHGGIPLIQASLMFLVGGAVGLLIAGVLEFQALSNLSPFSFVGVGLIEESAKLVFPIAVFIQGKYRSEADGLLFGVAIGMGFAALETMGFGLLSMFESYGNTEALDRILIIRGLLSPLGHAAWTGLICGAMWHYREQGTRKLLTMTAAYFILAVSLHTIWNLAASTGKSFITYPSLVAIGVLGLTFVFRHLRDAQRNSRSA